jgi:hypothetical protein
MGIGYDILGNGHIAVSVLQMLLYCVIYSVIQIQ